MDILDKTYNHFLLKRNTTHIRDAPRQAGRHAEERLHGGRGRVHPRGGGRRGDDDDSDDDDSDDDDITSILESKFLCILNFAICE